MRKNNVLWGDIQYVGKRPLTNISGNKFWAYLDGVKDVTSFIATFELSGGQLLFDCNEMEINPNGACLPSCNLYLYTLWQK